MKIRVEFTIDVPNPARFAVLSGLDTAALIRERIALDLAAHAEEAPVLAQAGARIIWHRLGTPDLPEAVRVAALNRITIREQLALDRDQDWG